MRSLFPHGPLLHAICSFELLELGGEKCILAWLVDITQRKRSEEQIREQAALLDKAPCALIVCDLDRRITYWNQGAERLYGWTSEQAIGRMTHELFAKSESPPSADSSDLALEKGEWTSELRQMTQRGTEVIVESRRTLLLDAQCRPQSVFFINTDITEKKCVEAQLLRSQRLESLGALAGGIAHDLNNVLAPILMALDLLKAKFSKPGDLKLVETLESSAQRGASMVKQILSFARGAQGEKTPLQLNYLVADLVKMVKETFPRSIQIRTQKPPDLWVVTGDATQIYQVLMNLCVNARDAMPRGGTVEIALDNVHLDTNFAAMHPDAKPGPHVSITVTDTGAGIPPEIIDKIFDPFFTTKEIGRGSGLGLSVVLGIVKNHGGFVTVYSEINKGTQFKVYLPAAGAVPPPSPEPTNPNLRAGHGECILVVDDERTIREITKGTLETYGYRVSTANDGTEAIALYAQQRKTFAAVITDMSMPYMDGPATIRALRRIDPNVRIIGVSGLAENSKTAEIQPASTVIFLQKPFTAERLLSTLNRLLRERADGKSPAVPDAPERPV